MNNIKLDILSLNKRNLDSQIQIILEFSDKLPVGVDAIAMEKYLVVDDGFRWGNNGSAVIGSWIYQGYLGLFNLYELGII